MGWAIGYDDKWERDVGYGVPSVCDKKSCGKEIDRGLSFVCGGDPFGGDHGCGLFFCETHRFFNLHGPYLCDRCIKNKKPFKPTPDTNEWNRHKRTDPTWAKWREKNPELTKELSNENRNNKGQYRPSLKNLRRLLAWFRS